MARSAACSWSPSADVATRWLAVLLAPSERSWLAQVHRWACRMLQVPGLDGHGERRAPERFHSPSRMADQNCIGKGNTYKWINKQIQRKIRNMRNIVQLPHARNVEASVNGMARLNSTLWDIISLI